jgi:glycosyltransferase involved in cell wall biosynthesis
MLWIKVGGLWPPTAGGRLRSYHMLAELSRRHRLSIVTTHAPGDDPATLRNRLPAAESVLSVPHAAPKQGSAGFALALARSWMSPLPVDVLRWRAPGVGQAVVERLREQPPDLIVADFLLAVANMPRRLAVPVLLFQHNVEHRIWQRLCAVERRPWRRTLLSVEWRKLRRYEARACRAAATTVTVSDADAADLAALAPRARVTSIPTGVDTAYFRPDGVPEEPGTLVFTGSMDWYPNEDAVVHLLESILPKICAAIPGVTLRVVGRNPSTRLRAMAAATRGVTVTGTVADVRPYVASAAVYVVPLRVGGGTRLKILEACAMGKAVVSTSVGAEGLPLGDGQHFVAADTPAAFADAVTTLLRDAARRRALGAAARRLVETHHSWRQVAEDFEAHCMRAAGHHAS